MKVCIHRHTDTQYVHTYTHTHTPRFMSQVSTSQRTGVSTSNRSTLFVYSHVLISPHPIYDIVPTRVTRTFMFNNLPSVLLLHFYLFYMFIFTPPSYVCKVRFPFCKRFICLLFVFWFVNCLNYWRRRNLTKEVNQRYPSEVIDDEEYK